MKTTDLKRTLAAQSLAASLVLLFAASPAQAEQRRDEGGGRAVIKKERTAKVDPGAVGGDRVRVAPVDPSDDITALTLAIGPGKDEGPKFDSRRARPAPVDPSDDITALILVRDPGSGGTAEPQSVDQDQGYSTDPESPGPLFTAEFLRLYLAWLGVDLQTALKAGLLSDPRLYAMFLDWLRNAGRPVPTADVEPEFESLAIALALEGADFEKNVDQDRGRKGAKDFKRGTRGGRR